MFDRIIQSGFCELTLVAGSIPYSGQVWVPRRDNGAMESLCGSARIHLRENIAAVPSIVWIKRVLSWKQVIGRSLNIQEAVRSEPNVSILGINTLCDVS